MATSPTSEPFTEPQYLEAFTVHRRLPPAIFDRYFDLLALPTEGYGRLLDVGAGPGLQTAQLLDAVPMGWQVVAIEPSPLLHRGAMDRLNQYKQRLSIHNTSFDEENNEESYDAVWMSEVVHLLGAPSTWVQRLGSITRPGSRILIRTSTHAQLRARAWYRHFPEALRIDLDRHPPREAIVATLAAAGFEDIQARTIDESRTERAEVVFERLSSRSLSTLHLLSDNEFEQGVANLRSELHDCADVVWDYEMTGYTATKRAKTT